MNSRIDGIYGLSGLDGMKLPTEGNSVRMLVEALGNRKPRHLPSICERLQDALDREAIRVTGGFVD